ncbi:MAG: spore germination protein [Clostridia bacterium]|nr:spore germination protein [Clostridia bacterium]
MKNLFDARLHALENAFSGCSDFAVRAGSARGGRYAVVYIKGIVSRDYISYAVIKPVNEYGLNELAHNPAGVLGAASFSAPGTPEETALALASGNVILLCETDRSFCEYLINAQDAPSRGVAEPSSDVTVRGPKAGFTEDGEANLAQLRRYIRTPLLRTREFTLGSVSNTRIIMCHVEGRASARAVRDLAGRINGLRASVITDSADLALLLNGGHDRLLPACGVTEKVNKAAAKLMAGRIALIVDGSPFVLTLPFVFAESIQSSDDYLHTPYYATFIRLLRLCAFLASVFAPGVLCALVTYERELLPQEVYGIIDKSRENVPEPFFAEILIVLLLFELLREVGVRMPRPVGDAVGIVGSIILGNTAVDAGIVSSVGVITVAFAAVCAFITPAYMYVIVLFRIAVLVLARLFGVFGLGLSAALLIALLCTRKSFGVPYLYPFSPHDAEGMQDFVFAWPKKTLGRREKLGGGK